MDLPQWLKRVERRIDFPDHSYNISQDGNPDGAFYGEIMFLLAPFKYRDGWLLRWL
jgi:hypothetical protein